MFLAPLLPPVARFAMRTFYRFSTGGAEVPREGPLLLVANHPNMVADPGAVIVVAGRPIRFLAKISLFRTPVIGSLMRSVGAVPVYRQSDGAGMTERNEAMFREVERALVGGSAVGVFPEGTSHSGPSLGQLRTGAARVLLSAARGRLEEGLDPHIPIHAVGITYRRKEQFRSQAFAFVGRAIEWRDLAGRSVEDTDAVRELTNRIGDALQGVTVNLDQWEDAPLVDCAEAVFAAENELERDTKKRVRRMQEIAIALRELRQTQPDRIQPLVDRLERFRETLRRLKLRPESLDVAVPGSVVARWIVRQVLISAISIPLLVAGTVLFYVPYRLSGAIGSLSRLSSEVRATIKILGGGVLFILWFLLLAGVVWWLAGGVAALVTLLILPFLASATLWAHERRRGAFLQARTYLMLQQDGTLRRQLLGERQAIARELEELRRERESAAATA